jgi:hypothetical protein
MVGWDTVTDICRDRGRISGEPSFVFLGAMRVQQSATAVCAAIRKSDVMTQASLWPRRRHAHSSMSALRSISTDAQKPLLFDHLVGESKQLSRFIQSEAFFPS